MVYYVQKVVLIIFSTLFTKDEGKKRWILSDEAVNLRVYLVIV